MTRESFKVSGMKCGGCEKTVQSAGSGVAGVLSIQASAKTGSVEVEFDETRTSLGDIQKAIAAKGFPLA